MGKYLSPFASSV